MAGERILVVDDDQGLLTLMKMRLEAAGYMAITAEGAEQALSREQDDPCDVAIVDLKLPGINGIALLEKLLHRHPHLPVLILTAHGSIASAVEATKKGAYDYLTKPFDPKDLLHRIEKAVEVRRLRGEVEQLRTLVRERYDAGNIIAASAKMQYVLRQVAQIAVTDSSVCLYGESGTGKELIGKSIHAMSRRARGPFVAINCGAIPEGLLENELFGHVKEPIRELITCTAASYDRLMVGRYFWMKSATFPTRYKSSSCGFSKNRNSIPWVQGSQRERIFGSSLRPTRICGKLCAAGDFERISTIGFMSSRLSSLLYESARKISLCWHIISYSISRTPSIKELKGFPLRPCSY
jgi:FixJ family two-component response regulator